MSRKVCVIGNGMTEFSKPGKSPDYHIMAREAGQQALAEAGIGYEEVDQAVVGYVYGESTSGERAVYELSPNKIEKETWPSKLTIALSSESISEIKTSLSP